MTTKPFGALLLCLLTIGIQAQTNRLSDRALWASINSKKDASLGDYQQHTGKVLVTWRMLPGDDATTGFDLYRTIGTTTERKIAANIRNRTCFQDGAVNTTADSPAGVYPITVSGAEAQNYVFTYVEGTLTIVDPTGIDAPRSGKQPTVLYDLQGRRTTQPRKGLYIQNGVKVVIK